MGRAPCSDKNVLKKGPWTPEEDQKLIDYIQKNGYGNWRTLPKNAGLQRCGKSCRLRWTNYLRPDIKRGRFSFEEEEIIIQLHSILGNKWSAIAARLPGRTDNEIKNYWNTHIRKRLLRVGIDPVTHRFLGVPLFNPRLLRIASSLFSSQNAQQTQNCTPQIQNQIPPFLQPNLVQDIPDCSIPYSNEAQRLHSNGDHFPSNLCQLNEWESNGLSYNLTEDFLPIQNYGGFYGTELPPSDTSTFHSNSAFQSNGGNDFGFASVLTPQSSPKPLNSSSAYINGGSTTTEDERESYCSSNDMMLKFENYGLPEMLNVGEFM